MYPELDTIYAGDALKTLEGFDSEIFDVVVTSPPYYKLRNYHTKDEIGSEQDYKDYIYNLILIMDQVQRVLKSTGSLWLVIGDTYAGNGFVKTNILNGSKKTHKYREAWEHKHSHYPGITTKSMMMIPERVAIAMCSSGWILRAKNIWSKDNVRPQGVADRHVIDYEYVFHFVKNNNTVYYVNEHSKKIAYTKPINLEQDKDYFWKDVTPLWHQYSSMEAMDIDLEELDEKALYDKNYKKVFDKEATRSHNRKVPGKGLKKYYRYYHKVSYWQSYDYYFDQQYEPLSDSTIKEIFEDYKGQSTKNYKEEGVQDPSNDKRSIINSLRTKIRFGGNKAEGYGNPIYSGDQWEANLTGRLARTTWRINTEMLAEKHYAAFPIKLVDKILDCAAPKGICIKCKLPLHRSSETALLLTRDPDRGEVDLETKAYDKEDPNLNLHKSYLSQGRIRPLRVKTELVYCDCKDTRYSKPLVLDPFIGSGSTAISALFNNCNYVGIDLNPQYVQMAKDRIEATVRKKLETTSL